MKQILVAGGAATVYYFLHRLLQGDHHHVYYIDLQGQNKSTFLTQLCSTDQSLLPLTETQLKQFSFINKDTWLNGKSQIDWIKNYHISEFWYFAPQPGWYEHATPNIVSTEQQLFDQLNMLSQQYTDRVFNFVGTVYAAGPGRGLIEEQPFSAQIKTDNPYQLLIQAMESSILHNYQQAKIPYRIFRCALMLISKPQKEYSTPIEMLVAAAHFVIDKADQKIPSYSQRFPLQLTMAPSSSLNLIEIESAITQVVAIEKTDVVNKIFHMTSEETIYVEQLISRLRTNNHLNIKIVNSHSHFLSHDQLMWHYYQPIQHYFNYHQKFSRINSDALVSSIKEDSDTLLAKLNIHHTSLVNTHPNATNVVQQKYLSTPRGILNYTVSGEGEHCLFIVNAFGLNLKFWETLIQYLSRQFTVVFWQHRNQQTPEQLNNVYYDQEDYVTSFVEDATRILKEEVNSYCHLLSWCSGPKLAMSLAVEQPELVDSLIMLTPSFPGVSGFEDQDSHFEKSLLTMCSLVNKIPNAAKSMITSMAGMRKKEAGNLDRFDPEINQEKTESIFSIANKDFTTLLYEPFTEEEKLINYSRQLIYFRRHDVAPLIPLISQPCLTIVGADDTTTNSDRALNLCANLPNSIRYKIRAGNHYLHTEQPELIYQLITAFIQKGCNMQTSDRLIEIN